MKKSKEKLRQRIIRR